MRLLTLKTKNKSDVLWHIRILNLTVVYDQTSSNLVYRIEKSKFSVGKLSKIFLRCNQIVGRTEPLPILLI